MEAIKHATGVYDADKLKNLIQSNKGTHWSRLAELATIHGLVSRTGLPFNQGSLWSEADRLGLFPKDKPKQRRSKRQAATTNGSGASALTMPDLEEIMTSNLNSKLKLRIIRLLAREE